MAQYGGQRGLRESVNRVTAIISPYPDNGDRAGVPRSAIFQLTAQRFFVLTVAYILFALNFLAAHPALADVAYSYDDLGRIKTVRTATGDLAEYIYDPVGNLLEVRTVASGTLAVTGMTPASGPEGMNVTLSGSGFSPNPAANTVKFNTVAATVLSATANNIVTTVPTGATTGPLTVTVGVLTATSRDTFTVTSSAGRLPPAITDFTPKIGNPGTTVSVTGANFDTQPNASRVKLNEAQANATVASTTSLTLTVPAKASSGRLSVATIGGLGTSAADFIVPPPGVSPASVAATARADVSQAATIAINAPNQYGLVLIEGHERSYLSLDLPTFNISPSTATLSYTVYAPDNTVFVQGKTVSATDRSIHLPVFTKTGTYTVAFNPGAATVSLTVQPRYMEGLVPRTAFPLSTTFGGQSIRVSFSGAIGDSLGVNVAGVGTTPAGLTVDITVYNPDGTVFVASTVAAVGRMIQLPVLSAAGLYTVTARAAGTALAALGLTLDPGTVVNVYSAGTSGPGVSTAIATAGESARYVYTIASGVATSINTSNFLTAGANSSTTVYNPAAISVGFKCSVGAACTYVVPAQTSTGPFSVVVQPDNGATGRVSAAVIASNPIGVLNPGSPVVTSIGQGQSAYFTFTATAGDSPGMFLQFSPNSGYLDSATTPSYIKIYKPDGALLIEGPLTFGTMPAGIKCNATTSVFATACAVQLVNLPASGTYSMVVQPSIAVKGNSISLTTTLYRDVVINPSPGVASPNTLSPSQNLKLSFAATAGESPSVFLQFAANSGYLDSATTPSYITVYKPDGTLLLAGPSTFGTVPSGIKCNATTAVFATTCTVQLANLPVSGNYTVLVQPYISTGTINVTATFYREAVIANLGFGVAFANILSPSQNLKLSFTATAGESPSVFLQFGPNSGYLDSTTTPGYIKIYKPDGTLLRAGPPLFGFLPAGIKCNATPSAFASRCMVQFANLPASGTYTVLVQPYSPAGANVGLTATVYHEAIIADPNPGIASPSTLSPSQNLKLSFTAAAGESPSVFLQFSPSSGYFNNGLDPTYIKIYKPDGTALLTGPNFNVAPTGITCNGGPSGTGGTLATACMIQLANLPASGSYTVLVQPYSSTGANVNVTATVYREVAFTLLAGAAASAVLSPAQNAAYRFTTVALSSPVLSLAFSPNSGYSGSNTLLPRYLKVYNPDGTLLVDGPVYGSTANGISCNNATTAALTTACTITMNSVPQTGIYKVVVQPYILSGTDTVTATVNGLK